jgi:hypothetical protein
LGLRQVETVRGGETNDHGEFRIDGLNPGEYILRVVPQLLAERTPGEPWLPTRDVKITVKAGEETKLDDLTMGSVRGGMLRVRMINETGETLQSSYNKFLHWRSAGGSAKSVMVPMLIMGGPERAEIPLTPGRYEIVTGWSRNTGTPLGVGRAIVDIAQRDAEVEIPVRKGVRLSGQVLIDQGPRQAPLSGLRCDVRSDMTVNFFATSAQDGSFVIHNVIPAVYRMNCAGLPADAFIARIMQGERDVIKNGVDVVAATDTTVMVHAFAGGGTIEGTILNFAGPNFSNAAVALISDAPGTGHLSQIVASDQKGGFTIRAVAPGDYHLYAWNEIDGSAYLNPDFMKNYEGQGTPVKVERGQKVQAITKLLDNPR